MLNSSATFDIALRCILISYSVKHLMIYSQNRNNCCFHHNLVDFTNIYLEAMHGRVLFFFHFFFSFNIKRYMLVDYSDCGSLTHLGMHAKRIVPREIDEFLPFEME